MTSMKDRQEGFERKFAMDEDQRFRAMARRNRLLGLWVAEQLGKSGEDAETYAREVIRADFEEAGDADVLRKVSGDLKAGGLDIAETTIRRTMDDLLATAVDQIRNA